MIQRRQVIKTAGAFIAWVIGSGFATGQEVLQFFSSFGYMNYAVILINLVGFIGIGYLLMVTGYDNKTESKFNQFEYFCGNKLGKFYTWLITATLLLLIPVLVAGGGATLNEYYGVNAYIGSAIMAGLVLLAYLIGFERMVKIISSLGPVIIFFSLIVGIITLFMDMEKWAEIPSYEDALAPYHAAPHWLLSGMLYLGLNFFPGSTYFTQLGYTAQSKKELKYAAILGGSALLLSITVVSTAIMLNGNATAGLDIPVLFLARKISYIFGAVFSIMLVLGIFSSCSVMMWSVCSRFSFKRKAWNTLCAVGVAVFAYLVSLLSFGKLIGTVYPIIGYIGLLFIGCVLYKGVNGITQSARATYKL